MTEFAPRYLADYQAPAFSIASVDLTLKLDDKNTSVKNTMVIKNISGANKIVLDGENQRLLHVMINEQEINAKDYQLTPEQLTLTVPQGTFSLTIESEISPVENTALEGLYKSGDAYCTQCEAEGFRRITYYLDRPDVLAVFTTTVIAPQKQYPYLLSNGNKTAQGSLEGGMHFVTWHDPHPKPCYLFALVAGDFDLLTDTFKTVSGRDVALEIFVDKGNITKAAHAMASLKKSMKWDEDTFGLAYDLDIYMIVAVDFFNMGAMENKGLNVFNSKFVLADKATATDTDYFNIEAVIAHEYFHNWTGNRVTCRDWFQLSLKEGLTVFRDQQFSADMHSAAVTRIQNVRILRSHQFAEDASPMSHPIRPEKVIEMNNFYTLTVYEKGAEVIRMIHTLLGKENFRKGMDLYFKRFDGMAVTCDDFVNAMADASSVDLTQFKRWYSQAGTPKLIVDERYNAQEQKYTLTIEQQHQPTANQIEKHHLHIPINIELITPSGNIKQLLSLTEAQQTWAFNNLSKKPVLAFLADFSAPVKVDFQQTDDELEAIMVNASDEFCRWDAGQKLMTRYIELLMGDNNAVLPSTLLTSFNSILSADIDPALIAEQLTLPSFDEIADNCDVVYPGKIVAALHQFKQFIAQGLTEQLLSTYQKLTSSSSLSVAQRALRNICLNYLAVLPAHQPLIAQQYTDADNMTDALAAFTAAAKNSQELFSLQQQHFADKWLNTTLVMDKWFSICAIAEVDDFFGALNSLTKREDFSLKNPNRARSLIGAFAMNNPKYFHSKEGKGYAFLADNIIAMNTINPQVAARLITPLLAFKRYEPIRQQLMKVQVERIAKLDGLSRDLQEKVNAALK